MSTSSPQTDDYPASPIEPCHPSTQTSTIAAQLANATSSPKDATARLTHSLARIVLATFIVTFALARILVILIMSGKLPPQLFFHMSGTHIHHLNYGITLLSLAGAYLIFVRPQGKKLSFVAAIYGMALALTFDEFGMWLHLGGPYWQRVSYDAVTLIIAILALIAYGSTIKRFHPKHHATIVLLVVVLGALSFALYKSMAYATDLVTPSLLHLEANGPG